jgi:23S rRNA G2445 N2-methylase RlmL
MSENNLDTLKKAYEQLAFVHQVLTQRTQFYIQEFEVAKEATKTITDMANKLSDQIKEKMEQQEAPVEVQNVEA